ncbi:hypothetical protein RTCIAT899_PC02815 (plasmid) [Rhizobium tropici CIAT 899]|nr:hypothetical protein RTCIAT899_PC02815 [Rhizobium tropici CIAT 899]
MAVRIVETEDALPPFLPLDGMNEIDMRRYRFECRIDVLMFEIEKDVPPPIGLGCFTVRAPDRLTADSMTIHVSRSRENDGCENHSKRSAIFEIIFFALVTKGF